MRVMKHDIIVMSDRKLGRYTLPVRHSLEFVNNSLTGHPDEVVCINKECNKIFK